MKIQNNHQSILNCLEYIVDRMAGEVAQRVVELLNDGQGVLPPPTIEVEASVEKSRLLTIKEVRERLGISRGTLDNWRKNKILEPDTYVGRSPRYYEDTIDSYVSKGGVSCQ